MNSDSKIMSDNQNSDENKKVLNTFKSMNNDLTQALFLFIKRTFDIICGLIGTLVFIPVALVLKICFTMTR